MEIQIDREFVLQHIPKRPKNAHKGTFGTLLVLAGSSEYRGAAVLAASGALRAGTGLVRLGSVEVVCAAAAASLPACTLFPVKENEEGAMDALDIPRVLQKKHTALLAGCGVTATKKTAVWVLSLLKKEQTPLVLDADAINILAGHLEGEEDTKTRQAGLQLLKEAEKPVVLTPHIGEMARLVDKPVDEVSAKPGNTALAFAAKYGCTVVLKSHETCVATAQGNLFVLHGSGNPGLSKGGSGDVLAGILSGLLAQGFPPEVASFAGVWLHAKAAEKAVAAHGEAGMSPADLPLFLAEVWRDLGR